ncbi:MAG TPA: hypothetical protein VL832_11430 [Puia sp.]|jgi:hypothetical protein|nr:hypothetical protein [Puia sp.]
MTLTEKEQQLLLEVAAMMTPDMLTCLYHGVSWFSGDEEDKIRHANELALKLKSTPCKPS